MNTSTLLARPRPVPPGRGGSLSFAGPNESNQSKGPHTIRMDCFGKKVRSARCGSASCTARPIRKANAFALHPGRSVLTVRDALGQPNLLAEASRPDRIQALCFGDFHLGQQMKVTGGAGPGPGAVSRAAQTLS